MPPPLRESHISACWIFPGVSASTDATSLGRRHLSCMRTQPTHHIYPGAGGAPKPQASPTFLLGEGAQILLDPTQCLADECPQSSPRLLWEAASAEGTQPRWGVLCGSSGGCAPQVAELMPVPSSCWGPKREKWKNTSGPLGWGGVCLSSEGPRPGCRISTGLMRGRVTSWGLPCQPYI